MKAYKLLVISLILIPIISISTYFLYQNWQIDYMVTTIAKIKVTDYYGVNLDNSSIVLGAVKPGGQAQRNFTIRNNDDEPHRIIIRINGPIEDWSFVTPNEYMLLPGEEKNMELVTKVPGNMPYGNYTSEVIALFMRT